jgi:hypothetical protein
LLFLYFITVYNLHIFSTNFIFKLLWEVSSNTTVVDSLDQPLQVRDI